MATDIKTDVQCQPGESDKDESSTAYQSVKEAFKHLIIMIFPIFNQSLVRYLMAATNYYFVSILKDVKMLGGLGLGFGMYVLFVSAMISGLDSAIIIIVPQLIGMGKKKESGDYFNSGFIVNTISSIPLLFLFWYSHNILTYLGQDETHSYLASQFLIGMIPGVFFIAQSNLMMFYLNAFDKFTPGILSALVFLAFQIALNYLFYFVFGLGLLGGGLSSSIAYGLQFVFLVGCLLYFQETRESLQKPTLPKDQQVIIIGQLLFTFCISIPLGCFFAFTCGLGLQGFWLAYAIRSILQAFFLWYLIWRKLNIKKEEFAAKDDEKQQEETTKHNEDAHSLGSLSTSQSYGSLDQEPQENEKDNL